GPVDRFNQSMLLQVPAGLRDDHLVAALQSVLDHHDALRLHLDAGAQWSLEVATPGAMLARDCLRSIDVTGLDVATRQARIAEHAQAAVGRLAPASGIILQAVWFDAG